MSSSAVDCATQREQIARFTETVRAAAVAEQRNQHDYEQKVNRFLDFILAEKAFFQRMAEETGALLPQAEGLSWLHDLDRESLVLVQEVIAAMHGLHESMRRRYLKANVFFARHKVGTQELRAYKAVADDLKELAADLHTRFFVFPNDDEFQAITNELQGL